VDVSLFDFPALSHNDDPQTSKDAARMAPIKRGTDRYKMLAAYARAPIMGLTDDEAGALAGVVGYNCRRRASELRTKRLIAPTGITRTTESGAQAQVCSITDRGMAALVG
jgi:hypothetical protein